MEHVTEDEAYSITMAWVALYEFIFRAGMWSVACLWYHPADWSVPTEDHADHTTFHPLNSFLIEGAIDPYFEQVNHHNYVALSTCHPYIAGAHNRYYFEPSCIRSTPSDTQFLQRSRLFGLLQSICDDPHAASLTTCELVDIGRLYSDMPARMAVLAEREILVKTIHSLLQSSFKSANKMTVDVLLQKMTPSFSGDLEDCAACSDLPWARATVRFFFGSCLL